MHLTITYSKREKLNFLTFLQQLCELVASLILIIYTSVRKINSVGYKLDIENILVLINSFIIRGVMFENI